MDYQLFKSLLGKAKTSIQAAPDNFNDQIDRAGGMNEETIARQKAARKPSGQGLQKKDVEDALGASKDAYVNNPIANGSLDLMNSLLGKLGTNPQRELDRYNIPAQIGAFGQMTPEDKGNYRNQVQQTVPRIPLPKELLGTAIIPQLGDSIINAIPNGVVGAADLPAARSKGEAALDAFKVLSGAVSGASALSAGKAGISALLGKLNPTPEAIISDTNITAPDKAAQLVQNQSLNGNSSSLSKLLAESKDPNAYAKLTEKSGWVSDALKSKFDYAVLTKDANTVKQLLPQIPPHYADSMGQQIMQALVGR